MFVSAANSESIFKMTHCNAGNYRNPPFFFPAVCSTHGIQQNTAGSWSGWTAEVWRVLLTEGQRCMKDTQLVVSR